MKPITVDKFERLLTNTYINRIKCKKTLGYSFIEIDTKRGNFLIEQKKTCCENHKIFFNGVPTGGSWEDINDKVTSVRTHTYELLGEDTVGVVSITIGLENDTGHINASMTSQDTIHDSQVIIDPQFYVKEHFKPCITEAFS